MYYDPIQLIKQSNRTNILQLNVLNVYQYVM